jgi:glucokinase
MLSYYSIACSSAKKNQTHVDDDELGTFGVELLQMDRGMMLYAIGIDIGGTRTKFGVVELVTGRLVARDIQPTALDDGDKFLAWLYERVVKILRIAGLDRSQIAGIGLGIPGYVDNDADKIGLVWESLLFMEQMPFRRAVEGRLDLPCRMDNDARLVALGEARYGAGRGAPRLLVLTLGTGLGVGLLVNGRFLENTSIAHMAGSIVIRPTGRVCPNCGLDGCLEWLVSATGLVERVGDALASGIVSTLREATPLTAPIIFAAAAHGDALARRAVDQLLADLSAGLNSYIHLFGPDKIVLGGGMSDGLAPYLDRLQSALVARPFPWYSVSLAVSELQEDAGLLGSAALLAP